MNWRKFFAERQSTILSGIAALLIIGLGFLAFNTLAENNNSDDSKKETKTEEKSESKSEVDSKESKTKTHTVLRGESLSKISKIYYNDIHKWTLIASANKISNPNLIYPGMKLTIPDQEKAQTPTTSTSTEKKTDSKAVITHKVVKGDSLWSISQKYYSGNGYHWVIIRDANKSKVGLLPNGRPLITPGTVLTIPPQLK